MSATPARRPEALRGPGPADHVLTFLAIGVILIGALADFHNTDVGLAPVVALTAASWLPLLVRHRWPLVVLGLVVAAECGRLITVPLLPPVQFNSAPVAVMLAAYELGRRRNWRLAWGASGVAALVVLVVGVVARSGQELLAANMFALDLVLAACGAGVLIRSRHRRLVAMERRALEAELTRDAEARRRVVAERLRMARELHDVVAHHLALVNAQAGVAEYLVHTDTDAAAQALRGIADHSRGALDELRATVGLLRQYDHDPQGDERRDPLPGLATLDNLIESHRSIGADLTLDVHGDPRELPAMIDLAAYRIVQEALTNARKHAPDAPVRVQLAWGAATLDVQVHNGPPSNRHAGPAPGTGHGLVGMRERALAAGGHLDTQRTGEGFSVHATLPTSHDSQTTPNHSGPEGPLQP